MTSVLHSNFQDPNEANPLGVIRTIPHRVVSMPGIIITILVLITIAMISWRT